MASPSTFFFAGIGTVILAIAGGFGGGLLVASHSTSSNSANPKNETPLVQAMQTYDRPKPIKAPEPAAEKQDDAANSSATTGTAARQSDEEPVQNETQTEEVAADAVPLPQPRPMMANVQPDRDTAQPERNAETQREQATDTRRDQAAARPMQRVKERNSPSSANAQNSERQGKIIDTQLNAAKGEAEFVDDNGVRHVVKTRSGRQPTRAEVKKVQDALRSMRRDREDFRMSYQSGERRGMFGLFRD